MPIIKQDFGELMGGGNAVISTFSMSGSYTININLGFKPKKIMIYGSYLSYTNITILDTEDSIDWGQYTVTNNYYPYTASSYITLTNNGFSYKVPSLAAFSNSSGYYMAI